MIRKNNKGVIIIDILITSPEMPYPPISGGRIRIYHVLRELSKRHHVYLISFVNDLEELKYKQQLLTYCKDVELVLQKNRTITNKEMPHIPRCILKYYSEDFQNQIDLFLDRYPIDIIQFEHSYMDLYRYNMKNTRNCKKVLIQHNIEHELHRQGMAYNWPDLDSQRRMKRYEDYLRLREFEWSVVKNQDLCVMMSETDKSRMLLQVPGISDNLIISPNGTDIDFFKPPTNGRARASRTLVFTAHMGYFPNEDGILWFYRNVFPHVTEKFPDLKVYVVGRDPSQKVKQLAMDDERFTVTGRVEDVREFLHSGTVFICPLRMGAGTRLKILEAMASEIPIVSTSIGCEGIAVKDGEQILMADDSKIFAEKVLLLLENTELRNKISQSARILVEEEYSWKTIVNDYERELIKLIGKG